MRIRKRLIVLILLIVGIIGYKYYKRIHKSNFEIDKKQVYIFKDKEGPLTNSTLPTFAKTSWKKYTGGPNYGIGILLSDTNSSWLGLVHAFKSFGIQFKIYTTTDDAIKHDVILVYPLISGKVFKENDLKKLDNYLRHGGTLIGVNVLGGLIEDFGFKNAIPSRTNFKVKINDMESIITNKFTDAKEQEISLGDKNSFDKTIGTYHYSLPATKPILIYENGEACMTQYYYKGNGKAFALGIDLGEFALRSENERGFNAQRTYVNDYEPSLDVLIRIIKNIYTSSASNAVTINTVPANKALTVCITHDIDFTRSIKYAVYYAKMEKMKNVNTTYFIQTKYVKDWNDDIFFNEQGTKYLNTISDLGMEIGSHSVAHSNIYSKFDIGTGTELYPDYTPFVKSKNEASGGTVLGELRVSKYLLEACLKNTKVVSFRPGHLSYPFALPQSLIATGYKFSSSVTANSVLTHLPYQLQYNRETEEELNTFEFPVTIEDEGKPRLDLRLNKSLELARKISNYGGLMNVLVHTDTLAYKLRYEEQLIDSLKNIAHFSSIKDFGNWWENRNDIQFHVEELKGKKYLKVISPKSITEIGFTIPSSWVLVSNDNNIEQKENQILIHKLTEELLIEFKTKK